MKSMRPSWIYVLSENFRWQSPLRPTQDCAFRDRAGKTRLLIEMDGVITVMKDYAWDGCTPKFHIMDLRLGISEGATHSESRVPCTYHATLVHDAMYQFFGAHDVYRRVDADRCFAALMRESEFRSRGLYYGGVRMFGGLWVQWIQYRRQLEGQLLVLSPVGVVGSYGAERFARWIDGWVVLRRTVLL